MKTFMKCFSGLAVIIFLFAGSPAVADTQHIDQLLESPFIALELNADAETVPAGSPLVIYDTDYPQLNPRMWAAMFLGDEEEGNEVQVEGYNYAIEHDGQFAKYFSDEARIIARYSGDDISVFWDEAQINRQAAGLRTTPEQAAATAADWMALAEKTIGLNGFVPGNCYAMPSLRDWNLKNGFDDDPENGGEADKGCYVVEYIRLLNNLPVAYDRSSGMDELKADTAGDYIQIWINDSGIVLIEGYVRCYNEIRIENLAVDLSRAVEILRENMDFAECFPEKLPCPVTEIGLCYRLVQTHPVSDKSAAAQMEARPAWRFATRINRREQTVFCMFIDAVTGEVLP